MKLVQSARVKVHKHPTTSRRSLRRVPDRHTDAMHRRRLPARRRSPRPVQRRGHHRPRRTSAGPHIHRHRPQSPVPCHRSQPDRPGPDAEAAMKPRTEHDYKVWWHPGLQAWAWLCWRCHTGTPWSGHDPTWHKAHEALRHHIAVEHGYSNAFVRANVDARGANLLSA